MGARPGAFWSQHLPQQCALRGSGCTGCGIERCFLPRLLAHVVGAHHLRTAWPALWCDRIGMPPANRCSWRGYGLPPPHQLPMSPENPPLLPRIPALQLAGLFATATFEGHIGISSLGACTAAAGDASDGFSLGQGAQLALAWLADVNVERKAQQDARRACTHRLQARLLQTGAQSSASLPHHRV